MKKLLLAILCSLAFSTTNAQNTSTIVLQKDTDLGSQTVFTSGYGNELDFDQIKSNWNAGKYITSLGYTLEGWYIAMSTTPDYTNQTYNYDKAFPNNWISEKFKEGFIVTDLAFGNGNWLVVMSKPQTSCEQILNGGSLKSLTNWVSTNWKKGLFITSVAYQGNDSWAIVMTKTSKYNDQCYFSRSSTKEIREEIKRKYDAGYYPTIVEYGGGWYFCICSKTPGVYNPKIETIYHNNNTIPIVQRLMDENYLISYVGGGLNEETSSSNNTYDALMALGEALNTFGKSLGGNGGQNNSYNNYNSSDYSGGSYNSSGSQSRKCDECAGNGKCSGKGSSSKYHCHGSGKCYACHGKSHNGVGRHETAGQYGDCGVCNNTGKCKYCDGTGKCRKCNGTGNI